MKMLIVIWIVCLIGQLSMASTACDPTSKPKPAKKVKTSVRQARIERRLFDIENRLDNLENRIFNIETKQTEDKK